MEIDEQRLRLEGIYRQNDRGEFMQRVKLPGGLLSQLQARTLGELGQAYGSGTLHLTTRGSVEFHNLRQDELEAVYRGLAAVGLFSRGACGGAVRGISCSSSFGPGYGRTQVLLRHFLRHFSGNPHFEGLPKKFKIAFEAGYERSRHLIQDLALVLVEEDGENSRYDVWMAGGLGRQPRPAFLFADRVGETELLPLAEAVIEVYRDGAQKGKRLKHLLLDIGEEELRQRVGQRVAGREPVAFTDAFDKSLVPAEGLRRVPISIFAGELPATQLTELAELAGEHGCQWLLVTPDQDLELLVAESEALETRLETEGFALAAGHGALRVCPGNHDCRMGLCATRDLAARIERDLGQLPPGKTLAISGCPNSCAQPQLAEFGIIASRLVRDGEERYPRFDLYRRQGNGLGEPVATGLDEESLIAELRKLFQD